MAFGHNKSCRCPHCEEDRPVHKRRGYQPDRGRRRRGGTFNSTAFRDKPQRNGDGSVNTYFNAGKEDGDAHGHVRYRDNPDGTTDYLFARDVEGNEYEV